MRYFLKVVRIQPPRNRGAAERWPEGKAALWPCSTNTWTLDAWQREDTQMQLSHRAITVGSTVVAIVVSGAFAWKLSKDTDKKIDDLRKQTQTDVSNLENLAVGRQVVELTAEPQSDGTVHLFWRRPEGKLAPSHYRVLWKQTMAGREGWEHHGGTIYKFTPPPGFGRDRPLIIGKGDTGQLASGTANWFQVRALTTCINGAWVRGSWSERVFTTTTGSGRNHVVVGNGGRQPPCPRSG